MYLFSSEHDMLKRTVLRLSAMRDCDAMLGVAAPLIPTEISEGWK